MRHKYKLLAKERRKINLPTKEAHKFAARDSYYTLHRIKALVDIPRHGVKAGDLGGYVANKHILSQVGDCWVGGESVAWGNTRIAGDALVSDNAILYGENSEFQLVITGNAIIDGCAVVETEGDFVDPNYDSSLIDEDVHIFGNSYIRNTIHIFGASQIYDNAQINDARYIYGETKIYENSFLLGKNSVSGTSEVFGRTTLGQRTIITGNSRIGSIGKNLYVPANRKLENCVMTVPQDKREAAALDNKNKNAAKSLATTRKFANGMLRHLGGNSTSQEEKNEYETELQKFMDSDAYSPTLKTQAFDTQAISIQTLDDIANRLDIYQKDIVKIIKYPLMVDTTDPFTAKMMMLFNKAQRLRGFSDNKQFSETVDALEEAFLAAESNALRLSVTKLSEDEKKKTVKATDLLRIAMDDAASDNEKQVAFKQGLKQLEGIILVPENAVEAFRIKAGIGQLTA